ncbi:MAG: phosphatidate cytidylyltransferase [Phycisphaerae bacterium]
MLKHRLFSGTLMTDLLVGLMLFDGWLDGSITSNISDDASVKGTIMCILIGILLVLGQLELSSMVKAKGIRCFLPVTIAASIILGCSWYFNQLTSFAPHLYIYFACALAVCVLFDYQYLKYGTKDVIINCGVNCFCIFYLGLLAAFSLGIRIDFGLWPLLMFVFVIKTADIGAYTAGSLFGKHKFFPNISPRKTWEGMAGAVITAVVISMLFSAVFDIMSWLLAVVFGIVFAFLGQFSDLAESLIKRDAEQKDSAASVPGFGGILDVMDSILLSAPFAYLFFGLLNR